MKILLVHNTYQQAGGEDSAVALEAAILTEAGHEVRRFSVSNSSIRNLSDKARAAWFLPWNRDGFRMIQAELERARPDVMHVHNFFAMLSPSIYDAAAEAGVPVVQTLHNFRTICANAFLLRDGKPCELCINGSPYNAVRYRCYRSSVAGSLALARMIDFHKRRGTWNRKVACFITPSDFARLKFIAAGFPADRIVVKPNSGFDGQYRGDRPGEGALFVGRLSEEKGIRTLVEAARATAMQVRIVGGGPLAAELKAIASPNVTFVGQLSHEAVVAEMRRTRCLVMPSIWYETFGMTVIEAYSVGLPVIASRIGSLTELVEDEVSGIHVTPGDAAMLARAMERLGSDAELAVRIGAEARRLYENKYTPERGIAALEGIYAKVTPPAIAAEYSAAERRRRSIAGSQKRPIRILLVHNTYQRAGGEDTVFANEAALLSAAGHEVHQCVESNDNIVTLTDKMKTAWRLSWSPEGFAKVWDALERVRPDVMHVHNFFALLSPSIYDAAAKAGVPVVQTLYNFRATCANALLLRDGKPCEICIEGSPYNAVRYRCYRGSLAGSLSLARMIDYHRRNGTWKTKVTRFVSLSDFARQKYVAAGFPADRIVVKPGSTPDPGIRRDGAGEGILYVGRLSEEKGIKTLVEAARATDAPVRVAGVGPLNEELRANAPANVTFLGQLSREAVFAEMRRARCLVMPTICFETFGMSVVEAYSIGLPVIASHIGALIELVQDGVTGKHFEPGDGSSLARAMIELAGDANLSVRMGHAARRRYENEFTPAIALDSLEAIYRSAIGQTN